MVQGSARARYYERAEADDSEYESPGARDAENTLRLAHHAQRLKAIETGIENLAQSMAVFRASQRRLLRRQTVISLAVGGICLLATLIAAILVGTPHASPARQSAAATPAAVAELPAPTETINMASNDEPEAAYVPPPTQQIIKPVAMGRYGDVSRGGLKPIPAAKLAPPKVAAAPAAPPRQLGPFENSVRTRLAASRQAVPASWRPMFDREASGDLRGKLQIAAKFLKGEEVKADPVFAVSMIRQAAIGGNKEAMMWLAQSYEAGNFGRADPESALRWYTNAAKAGVTDSYVALGRLYERGIDGAPDREAALAWYQRGAQAGDAKSADAVARMTRTAAVSQDSDDALLAAEPYIPMANREGGPLAATPVVASAPSDPERSADIRAAQRMLKVLGYKIDKDDGALGPQTQAAIRAYQRDRAAYPDGEYTPELLESLTKEIRYGQ